MLDKLQLVLQYSIVNGRLILGVTSPLPPEASKLLRAVPGRTLDLREASLELTGAGEAAVLKISGAVSGWPVQQNPRVTLEGARLSMIIGIPRADGATEVRLEVRGQLRSDAMTADVQGTLTGSAGRWQLTAGSVQATDIGSVLAAVWGAGHMQPLPADALSAMQFAGIGGGGGSGRAAGAPPRSGSGPGRVGRARRCRPCWRTQRPTCGTGKGLKTR